MTNIPANPPDPGVSGQQTSTFSADWSPPPFIKNPLLRWGLLLGLILYLFLSIGSLDVNWHRIYVGLDRGAKFVYGFMDPNFAGRWTDISEGIIESLVMTVTSTAIGIVFPFQSVLVQPATLHPYRYICFAGESLHFPEVLRK